MTSTIITTNADALSRAADTILAKKGQGGKNAILNSLAAAIAGPGKDWGFLRNAPTGQYTQAGLSRPAAEHGEPAPAPTATKLWLFDYIGATRHGPRIFPSKRAALQAIAADYSFWKTDRWTLEDALSRLENNGEVILEDDEEEPSFGISLSQVFVEPDVKEDEPLPRPEIRTLYVPDIFGEHSSPSLDDGRFFSSLSEADRYAKNSSMDADHPGWRKRMEFIRDCKMTAEFDPQVLIRESAFSIDPQGDTVWEILPDDIEPEALDTDYLKDSTNAPAWVREWTGPFSLTLLIQTPQRK